MNVGEEGRGIEKISTHKYIRPLIKKEPSDIPFICDKMYVCLNLFRSWSTVLFPFCFRSVLHYCFLFYLFFRVNHFSLLKKRKITVFFI